MSSFDKIPGGLRAQFLEGAMERLARISRALDALSQCPPQSAESTAALKELMRQFHSLSGAGGTFGFPAISALGRRSEEDCLALIEQQIVPTDADVSRWRGQLAELSVALNSIAEQSRRRA